VKNNHKYDWVIVGGGASGIAVAEILCREGKSVLLIEKNSQIASETTKVFHEWFHSGSLYSLVPDNLLTLRYLLGATDDLLEYYSGFSKMNLSPTESGISVTGSNGWFNEDRIEYKYKIRKLNPIWMSLVSRSINIINMINNHDWLRRRAGSEYDRSKLMFKHAFNFIPKQIFSSKGFYSALSPDLTINSRLLISDLISVAISKGLEVVSSESVTNIEETKDIVSIKTLTGSYEADNVVICSPDVMSEIFNIPIKTGFAPIAVVENITDDDNSFVELDYYPKKCINLLKKKDGIGQAGGITINNKKDIKPYLDYIISEHKKRNPRINVVDSYIGLKKELVQKGENRNYLYHINKHSPKIWSIVLGKFTLAFSMAPEFYRRVYHKNPTKHVNKNIALVDNNLISKTSWQEIINNKRAKSGNDQTT
jgi:hypothetical protein